ncbi:MAG: TetR/AcrR family transcriptional regulator [Rhodomicrobiaceae bacterium]
MNVVTKKRTPRPRNSEATRARILDAAVDEFSAKGFDGARVDAVAKAAGVNINLVYHYFSSKEGLFIAVMERAYKTIRTHHKDMELRTLDPATAMAELVRSTFRMFIDHPEIIGLLGSENMHEARHIRKSAEIQTLYNPLLDFIAETLKRGEAEGIFRSGVDPVELFISINAEGYFYLSNRHTLGYILHQDLLATDRLAAREAHIIDVILSFLRSAG